MSEGDGRTGYGIVKVHATKQFHQALTAEEVEEERSTRVSWDWRAAGPGSFQVFLGFEITGPKEAPERVEVEMVGTFQIEGDSRSLDLEPFVQFAAPAMLVPYIRQVVTNLTSQGPFEPLLMSPLNVYDLMDFARFTETTGYTQAQEDVELAESLGLTLDEPDSAGETPADEAGED